MATARRRPSGQQDASRLAATVAREIDLMAARRTRLRERQNDLRAQLRELDIQLHALDSRERDLDRLIADGPAAVAGSTPRLLGGATLRKHAVAHLLATDQQHDIHYRTWYEQLAADGLLIRGADPAATLLTNITRSPLITRGEEPGTYRLDLEAAQRVETLLVKARERLHAATGPDPAQRAPQRAERLRAMINRLARIQREIAECRRIAAERASTRPKATKIARRDQPQATHVPNGAVRAPGPAARHSARF